MSEEKKGITKEISRREFLRDAGVIVGGTAVGSAFFLSACGKEVEVTKTVTTTAPGNTVTSTQTTLKYACPICSQEFNTLSSLTSHFESAHSGEGQIITKYICPECNEEFPSISLLREHMSTNHPAIPENIISMTVNNDKVTVFAEPSDTLRDVLRDQLGLISVKDMCYGYGACGSCTVIMNNRPVLACMTLACECEGVTIETAESLGDTETPHPLVEAYAKHFCAQCGYCTPGFVITAKALLDKNPNPTEEDIREALGGNLCRCGTYPQHIKATKEAASVLRGGN